MSPNQEPAAPERELWCGPCDAFVGRAARPSGSPLTCGRCGSRDVEVKVYERPAAPERVDVEALIRPLQALSPWGSHRLSEREGRSVIAGIRALAAERDSALAERDRLREELDAVRRQRDTYYTRAEVHREAAGHERTAREAFAKYVRARIAALEARP